MIASGVVGLNSSAPSVTIDKVPEIRETMPSSKKVNAKSITVEEYVRSYFSDVPVLAEVAKCESRFRQYDKDGNVLRGVENSLDKGVMQINAHFHEDDAMELGYDIDTLEGNTAYGRYLYEKYGLRPWSASAPCWKKTTAYADYADLALK
jgi:hypothetical protein